MPASLPALEMSASVGASASVARRRRAAAVLRGAASDTSGGAAATARCVCRRRCIAGPGLAAVRAVSVPAHEAVNQEAAICFWGSFTEKFGP